MREGLLLSNRQYIPASSPSRMRFSICNIQAGNLHPRLMLCRLLPLKRVLHDFMEPPENGHNYRLAVDDIYVLEILQAPSYYPGDGCVSFFFRLALVKHRFPLSLGAFCQIDSDLLTTYFRNVVRSIWIRVIWRGFFFRCHRYSLSPGYLVLVGCVGPDSVALPID